AAPASGAETITFETWREPHEGAYTIDVPRGWRVSGGIRRVSPVDVRSAVNVVSPDGVIHIFIGDFDLMPRRELDPAARMAGLREGQVIGGSLIAQYMTGAQVAGHYPAWKLCRDARILQSGVLRRETESLNAQVAQYGRSMATAASASVGEAIFQCSDGQGFVMATTLLARPAQGRGVSVWTIHELSGFLTRDPQRAYYAKYILSQMLASLKMNREWEARTSQAAGQYAKSVMQMSDAITQTTVQHAKQQAALGSAGGWNHPNTGDVPKITQDPHVEEQRDIANRGTRQVCDDIGTCKTVDNSWAHVFHDNSGNVRPGSASGYPPDYSGQWTEMK
ncbi:MAG TPA: hypothetical protein VEE84_01520, partial [Burkholderiaceae bacterium]|nr:hypothetical protein [Burkholderiaceae bacterium]